LTHLTMHSLLACQEFASTCLLWKSVKIRWEELMKRPSYLSKNSACGLKALN
jgi:hypothetical protein